MKNILYTISGLLMLVVSGCSDFLDEVPQGRYTSDTFWKTEAHAELALTGVYEATSFSESRNALWAFGDMASDDAIAGGNPGDWVDALFIDQFTYLNTNP
ncbi:MAG TPA: hypothetical protein VFM90_09090, partial [Cyclobacteriaceae bacterium]|nr:hypothetical protein [Cyclobacteriaceae bacterium]